MFTTAYSHGALFDAMSTSFRRAAEAEFRQQATRTPAPPDALLGRRTAEWQGQARGHVAAALASALFSMALLSSVVLGMTAVAPSVEVASIKPAAWSGVEVALGPLGSPLSLSA